MGGDGGCGYTPVRLAQQCDSKVGVFAGVTRTGYDLYGPELWRDGDRLQPRTSFASIANRVSFLLNPQGPSMPIDTMCSSSLTAIHEACQRLRFGDCAMAIAGGVNLYLHPSNMSSCRRCACCRRTGGVAASDAAATDSRPAKASAWWC